MESRYCSPVRIMLAHSGFAPSRVRDLASFLLGKSRISAKLANPGREEGSNMDEFDHSFGGDLGPFTIVSYVLAFGLCLMTCLMSFSEMSQVGPDVGEIVTFDPHGGPKHWDQPGIPADFAASTAPREGCVLM